MNADGSAEFVDNSMQAYMKLAKHTGITVGASDDIQLRLILAKDPSQDSFFVVADRACGMDENGVTQFSQYALDKESRGQGDEEFISKFGVGAKQSGFFLGSRIHLITRAARTEEEEEAGCKVPPIYDVCLDADTMEMREKAGDRKKVFEAYLNE